jgi:MFS family permease
MLQFNGYSIITGIFCDQLLKYIGFIEIAVGLGLGLGPMIGGLVVPYFQYEGAMLLLGCIILLGMALCYFTLPDKLNEAVESEQK